MDILGLGVALSITGESGLGKSNFGLELISRTRLSGSGTTGVSQTALEGRCQNC
jgi:serine kinase of HPr protein (carbohydrate metabolism regulator)